MSRYLLVSLSCACLSTAALVTRFDNATITRSPNNAPISSGSSYAKSCNNAKQDWLAAGGSSYEGFQTWTNTDINTINLTFYDYPTYTVAANTTPYTLCDGYPRISGSLVTSSITRISTSLETDINTYTGSVFSTLPTPTCLIASDDCASLMSSYSAATATISSVGKPICGLPALSSSVVGDPVCAVQSASVQLLYWPVTRYGNACGSNASTQTLTPTISGKPNTAVFENSTLTSPTVYLAIQGTWDYHMDKQRLKNQTQFIVPYSATSISSLCAQPDGTWQTRSMNYGDLDGPIPASAYRCQPRCHELEKQYTWNTTTSTGTAGVTTDTVRVEAPLWTTENQCSTIYNDYRPGIAVPEDFQSYLAEVDLGWGVCQFIAQPGWGIFYDPPKALAQVSSVKGVEMPVTTTAAATVLPESKSAEPVSSMTSTIPKETSAPQTTNTPLDPSQSPWSSPSVPQSTQDRSETATSTVDTETGLQSSTTEQSAQPQSNNDLFSQDVTSSTDQVSATKDADPALTTPSRQSDAQSSPQTTSSQGIAGIIASVIGMTSKQSTSTSSTVEVDPAKTDSVDGSNDPTSVAITTSGTISSDPGQTSGSSRTTIDPATATNDFGETLDNSRTAEVQNTAANNPGTHVSEQAVSSSGQAQATGVVLTGSQGRVVTFIKPSPSGTADSVSLALPEKPTTSLAGIGNVVADPSGLVVEGSTQAFSALSPDPTTPGIAVPVFTAGAETFSAVGTSAVVLASGVTLQPGGSAIKFSSQVISLAPSASFLVVDGSTQTPAPLAPKITVAGQTFQADGTSNVVLGSDITLQAGGPAVTYSDHVVSVATSGSFVVVDGTTQGAASQTSALSATHPTPVSAPFIVAGTSDVILGSDATVHPGGPAVTYSGHVISLAPSGSYVVVDGATHNPATAAAEPTRELVIDQHTYTLDASSKVAIDSEATLAPGSVVTVSGTTLSLAQSASYVVVNGETQSFAARFPSSTQGFIVDQHTYTLDSSSELVVGPEATLAPGSAVTISGTTISLAPSASYIVVNGKTVSPSAIVAPSTSTNLGNSTVVTSSVAGQSSAGNATISITETSLNTPSATDSASPTTTSADSPFLTTASGAAPRMLDGGLSYNVMLLLGFYALWA